jgi:integrase
MGGPSSGDTTTDIGATARSAGTSSAAPGVCGEVELALQAWEDGTEFSDQTLLRSEETMRRFARRLEAQGVTSAAAILPVHCQGFIDARTRQGQPPALTTQHARRVALRMLFRTWRDLGLDVTDPTLDLRLPPRTTQAARPLSDAEITLGRVAARLGLAGSASLQRATAWALAEATAVTSEISTVRACDLDDPTNPRYVHLPGTRRADPRLGELTDWGAAVIQRQARLLHERGLPPSTLLTYRGAMKPGQQAAQASVCNAISAVLAAAGLSTEPDVRPGSVRNWAGRRLYDQGMPLERVATRLGHRSLDATAEDIGLEWRKHS